MKILALSLVLSQAPSLPPNHPALAQPAPLAPVPTAEELLARLDAMGDLKSKDKPFEVAVSVGKLYFAHGRYHDAQVFLEQAAVKGADARGFFATLKKRVGASLLPTLAEARCSQPDSSALDPLISRAKEKAKTDPLAAATCAKAALNSLIDAENTLALAKFLQRDLKGALETYAHTLALFDDSAEALYGHAAVVLDSEGDNVAELNVAKAELERLLAQTPLTPHAKQAREFEARIDAAISAGGISKIAPRPSTAPAVLPPVLSQETIDAFAKTERTPQMEENFKKLVDDAEDALAHGRYQDALNNYKQVMPFQPENPRLRAGMAWTMVRLNRQPMADNVWRVAAGSPEALDALGDSLKAKGDAEGAKALWARLKQSVPSYAEKLNGKL